MQRVNGKRKKVKRVGCLKGSIVGSKSTRNVWRMTLISVNN